MTLKTIFQTVLPFLLESYILYQIFLTSSLFQGAKQWKSIFHLFTYLFPGRWRGGGYWPKYLHVAQVISRFSQEVSTFEINFEFISNIGTWNTLISIARLQYTETLVCREAPVRIEAFVVVLFNRKPPDTTIVKYNLNGYFPTSVNHSLNTVTQ